MTQSEVTTITCRMMAAAFFLLFVESLESLHNGTLLNSTKQVPNKVNTVIKKLSNNPIIPGNTSSLNITGGPSKSSGLPGDTLDMPYTQRLIVALGILTVAMILSLLVCYRKECNVMYWRYKKKSPRVKYEPLKVKMQVPPDV